jgi:hypothetical protein
MKFALPSSCEEGKLGGNNVTCLGETDDHHTLNHQKNREPEKQNMKEAISFCYTDCFPLKSTPVSLSSFFIGNASIAFLRHSVLSHSFSIISVELRRKIIMKKTKESYRKQENQPGLMLLQVYKYVC